MTKVLEGVRVLDFGRVVASAYCGTLLADMGAEVIKVERPGGEFDRELGPFAPDGRAIVYELITPRNKKSITLDCRHPSGRETLDRLVKKSSIVISGFTRKGNRLMGLDYDRLKQINPGIILVAVSGYGQVGPYADRPAFDAIAQAESGAMSFCGFPENPPTRSAVHFTDFSTAVLGAYGAVLALLHLERTGVGQLVDVALLDTAFAFVTAMGVVAEYTLHNHIRPQIGNSSFYNLTDAFQAKDGWVMISAVGNEIWKRLAEVMGRQDLTDDDRFKDDDSRYRNRHILHPIVSDWVAQYTVDQVVECLEESRVPCGRVNSVDALVNDPHLLAREMLVNRNYPGIGTVPLPGVPVKLSETPGRIETIAPRLGEHNEEVFCDLLDYSLEDLEGMRDEGVI
jgi:crotonobetainyl-CoA:carnitine CoA-transferase CaiB-like acyl-CoA transferase